MRSLLTHPALCMTALMCATLASQALAQRAEMPPINPSATPRAPAPRAAAVTNGVPAATTTPKAALVQIVDDDAHGAYKEGVFNFCNTSGVCIAQFSTVPAGHRRLVEHLSCSVHVPTTGALRYVAFLATSYTAPRDWMPYTRSAADAGQYFINSATLFPFEAGETPMVYADSDLAPIDDLTCTATGRDIVLP